MRANTQFVALVVLSIFSRMSGMKLASIIVVNPLFISVYGPKVQWTHGIVHH